VPVTRRDGWGAAGGGRPAEGVHSGGGVEADQPSVAGLAGDGERRERDGRQAAGVRARQPQRHADEGANRRAPLARLGRRVKWVCLTRATKPDVKVGAVSSQSERRVKSKWPPCQAKVAAVSSQSERRVKSKWPPCTAAVCGSAGPQ